MIYFLVWIIFLFTALLCAEISEHNTAKDRRKQWFTKRIPRHAILLVYLFALMNPIVTADTFGEFFGKFFRQSMTATFFALCLHFSVLESRQERRCSKQLTVVGFLYFFYTVIKNIIIRETVIGFLFAEIISLATIVAVYFVTLLFSIMFETKVVKDLTPEQIAARDKWYEARAREKEYFDKEWERLYPKQSASSSYSGSSSSDSSSSSKTSWIDSLADSAVSAYEKKREVQTVELSSSRRCANCSNLRNGVCMENNESIYNPNYQTCGFHRY